jgi:hypothetical protein
MFEFGSDGYVAWFGTIEIIAEDLEAKDIRRCGKNVQTLVKESPRFFSEQLIIPIEKLKKIYLHIKSRKKGRFIEADGRWTISIPKVLEFMDEWTERVMKEAQEELPSDSGKSRAEQSRREEMLAGLKKGAGGPGAGSLALLAEEFSRQTGRAAFNRVRNPQHVLDTLAPVLKERGYEACAALMTSRIQEVKERTGKPPANISYFIPIFKDPSAFANGKHAPAPPTPDARRGPGGPASVSDLTKGILPGAAGGGQ